MLDRGGGSQSFDVLRKQRNIVLLGYSMVGKTAICTRFVNDRFRDAYEPTYEKAFSKVLSVGGQEVECVIKDTQGLNDQEIFRNEYGLGYHGYVLVYSIASKSSLEILDGINAKLLDLTGNAKVPRLLVGAKADLGRSEVSTAEAKAAAARWGIDFVECSAKFNHNIDLLFDTILREVDSSADSAHGRRWGGFKRWLVEPHGRKGHSWGTTFLRVLVSLTMMMGLAAVTFGICAITHGVSVVFAEGGEEGGELVAYVLMGFGLALSLASAVGLCGLSFKSRELLNVCSAALVVIIVSEVVVWLALASKAVLDESGYVVVTLLFTLLVQSLCMGGVHFFQRLVRDFDDWDGDDYTEI